MALSAGSYLGFTNTKHHLVIVLFRQKVLEVCDHLWRDIYLYHTLTLLFEVERVHGATAEAVTPSLLP